jgi:hypothetical protein
MKLIKLRSPFWSLFVVALLVGLPGLCSEAKPSVVAAALAGAVFAAAAGPKAPGAGCMPRRPGEVRPKEAPMAAQR